MNRFPVGMFRPTTSSAVRELADISTGNLNLSCAIVYHSTEQLTEGWLSLTIEPMFTPEKWVMYIAGGVSFVAGLLLVARPNALEEISRWADKSLFQTDRIAYSARRVFGILLLLAGIYIYWTASALQ